MKINGKLFLLSVYASLIILTANTSGYLIVHAESQTAANGRKRISAISGTTHSLISVEGFWLMEPFDISKTTLPRDFNGHNLKELYQELKRRETTTKGEFETTSQFEQRKRSLEATGLVGDTRANDLFAFVISNAPKKERGIQYFSPNQIETKYDADTENMSVSSNFGLAYIDYDRSKDRGAMTWGEWIITNEEFTASNAFGAQVKGQRLQVSSYGLMITNPRAFSIKFGGRPPKEAQFVHTMKMDLSTARESKDDLAVLVIGKLARPNTIKGFWTVKPTFSNPKDYSTMFSYVNIEMFEYWIFNRATGQVFMREKAK